MHRPRLFPARPDVRTSLQGAAALGLLVGMLGGLACGTTRGPVKLTEPVEREGQWSRVLDEHTRRNQHYNWPTLEADLRATLVTPRLRSAFIADRQRFHGHIAEELADELVDLGEPPDEGYDAEMIARPQAEEQVLVLASIFVRDTDYRDLDASTSIWDIHLVRGDARVEPLAIEPLRFSAGLQLILPYVDRFDESYLLRFPLVDPESGQPLLSPGGDPLRLEVKSAIGDVIAEWTLVGQPGEEGVAPGEPLPEAEPLPGKEPLPRKEPLPGKEPASDEEPAEDDEPDDPTVEPEDSGPPGNEPPPVGDPAR